MDSTYNAFVKVPLDSNQHISQSSAEVRGWVNVLSCPYMVTHLHQHGERVETVNLVTQSDEAVELHLDALEDFVHHQPHHVFPLGEREEGERGRKLWKKGRKGEKKYEMCFWT